MAKTLRYPNGQILKGTHSRVGLMRGVKRSAVGAIVLTAIATPTQTAKQTAGTKFSFNPALKVTGTTGARGRNFVRGSFVAKGTGCSKILVSVKTIAGTQSVDKTTVATAATISFIGSNSLPLPIKGPGTLIVKATAATKVLTLSAKVLSVNDLTSQMM